MKKCPECNGTGKCCAHPVCHRCEGTGEVPVVQSPATERDLAEGLGEALTRFVDDVRAEVVILLREEGLLTETENEEVVDDHTEGETNE